MNPIRCIAIDDEPPALKVLEHFCGQTPGVDLIAKFTRPSEALHFLEDQSIDLLFMDVRMPSISGIELYKELEGKYAVIFTTAYSEYAVESFNLNAVDYLLKPFTYERFLQAVNKAAELLKLKRPVEAPNSFLVIKADYGLIKINCNEISFIESQDDYIKIYSRLKKPIVARLTMKAVQEKLSAANFVRIHRSYIVALDQISEIKNKVIFIGETALPLSSSYEKNFYNVYKR
ncbi:MAG: LytTR family DNA-binding domain-containing protein [Chitinophagales bacterium]